MSYLALAGGPAGFKQDFSCPVLLERTNIKPARFSRTRLSRPLVSHSNYSANHAGFLLYSDSVSCWSQIRSLNRSLGLWLGRLLTHNPILSIRLTTYSSEDENLKGLGSYGFARHYSRNRYLLSFPRPTKMFQFRRFPFNYPIDSGSDAHDMTHGGFPHSDIPGSKLVDSSPRLFAVFHVLHR